jgi:hypothetical protein
VASALDGAFAGTAHPTRHGTVILRTHVAGPATYLRVRRASRHRVDAAAALGLVGYDAFDRPYRSEPARLVCRGAAGALHALNLSTSQIELHSDQGTRLLPAHTSLQLTANEAAQPQLQRLVRDGVVQLAAEDPS